MPRYESPSTWNLTEPTGLFSGLTDTTGTVISNFFLVAVFIIFMGGYWFARRDPIESFAVGSFVTWVIAVIMFTSGFVGWASLMILTVLMIIGFAGLWIEKKQ